MKSKLFALFLVLCMTFVFAAGCAGGNTSANNSQKQTSASQNGEGAGEGGDGGASNIAQDPLHFMQDGQIRVDTKFASGHSLDGVTVKINGEAVTFGTAKAYSGEITFTVEGSVDFALTAAYIITDGNALSTTGKTTVQAGADFSSMTRALNGYAAKLTDNTMKRMYVVLTDDKDAIWNAALA